MSSSSYLSRLCFFPPPPPLSLPLCVWLYLGSGGVHDKVGCAFDNRAGEDAVSVVGRGLGCGTVVLHEDTRGARLGSRCLRRRRVAWAQVQVDTGSVRAHNVVVGVNAAIASCGEGRAVGARVVADGKRHVFANQTVHRRCANVHKCNGQKPFPFQQG